MNENATLQRYGLVAQSFHWFVALLLIGLFVTDSLRGGAPKGDEMRVFWLNLHMSLGILLFLVTIARLGWRRLVPPPPPVDAPKWSLVAANVGHVLLNLSTLLVPIAGYLRVASKDRAADFFGVQIPSIVGDMPWLHELTESSVHGEPMEVFMYTLIGLHVAAALWHQYIRKDDALRRMLPW